MKRDEGVTYEFEGWPLEGLRCWSVFTFDNEKEARREFKKVHRDWKKTGPERAPREPVLYRVERTKL